MRKAIVVRVIARLQIQRALKVALRGLAATVEGVDDLDTDQ